jgi:hypothetical protein
MFKDDSRTMVMKEHPTQGFSYAEQTIYGCGPLSIPILDPRLVLEYQKSHLPEQCFEKALTPSIKVESHKSSMMNSGSKLKN